jgi:hypothetical protein
MEEYNDTALYAGSVGVYGYTPFLFQHDVFGRRLYLGVVFCVERVAYTAYKDAFLNLD